MCSVFLSHSLITFRLIQAMASFGLVDERASSQIQSLLICIEMMIASIAHYYIFPFEEWQEGYQREHRKVSVLNDTLAVRDFVADFKRVVSRWESGIISEQEVAFDLEQSLQHNISVNNTPEKKGERGGGAVESSEGAALLSARSEDKSPWRTNRGYDDIRVDTLQWTSPQVDAGSGERTGLLSGRRSGGSAVNMPKISYGAWSDTVSPMVDSRKELDQQAGEENTSL